MSDAATVHRSAACSLAASLAVALACVCLTWLLSASAASAAPKVTAPVVAEQTTAAVTVRAVIRNPSRVPLRRLVVSVKLTDRAGRSAAAAKRRVSRLAARQTRTVSARVATGTLAAGRYRVVACVRRTCRRGPTTLISARKPRPDPARDETEPGPTLVETPAPAPTTGPGTGPASDLPPGSPAQPPPPARPPGPPVAPSCSPSPLPRSGPASSFTDMWSSVSSGWTGGDGVLSVELPDGRTVWLFGDTLLTGGHFVRNTLVVQDGPCLITMYGGSSVWPSAFVSPDDPSAWYWPSQPFVENGTLALPLSRMVRTGPGPWDFAPVGVDIVTYALPGLQPIATRTLPDGARVLWGAAKVDAGAYSYVFGVEDHGPDKSAHVARAPAGQAATAPWEYWTGDGWSSDPAASVRVLTGVSNQLSVLRTGDDEWTLISQRTYFSPHVAAYSADEPTGPYGAGVTVATFDVPAGALSYNAVAHPQFGTAGGVLLSTSLNALDGGDLAARPDLYRPRFLRAVIPGAE